MTDITIRQVFDDEITETAYWANSYAFHASPPLPSREERDEIIRGRRGVSYFVLFEDERPVSTAATTQMMQNIRGSLYPAGGVWGVATRPEARRRGYCRQVMTMLLEAEKDAGRAVSLLYPFRGSFYERLGYVTFPLPRKAKFSPQNLAGLLKKDFGGTVELRPIAEAGADYFGYAQIIQGRTHGFALFDFPDKERSQRENRWWLAEAKVNGVTEGIMLYDIRGEEVTNFHLRALRFYTHSGRARYLLLQWIASHIDQAGSAEIWLPPFEYPETWYADLRPEMEPVFFAPMARVVNIAALEGLPAGPGRVCLEVADSQCPWNCGAWTFKAVDGRLRVSPGGEPDCKITIQGLTALVYGTHHPGDFSPLGWGDVPQALWGELEAMFPRAVPYLHEMF